MQLEIALALSRCATAEVNIVRFVTCVCLVTGICMIPPFIPFPSSSNIYKINVRPIRLYLTLPTANCNADIGKS